MFQILLFPILLFVVYGFSCQENLICIRTWGWNPIIHGIFHWNSWRRHFIHINIEHLVKNTIILTIQCFIIQWKYSVWIMTSLIFLAYFLITPLVYEYHRLCHLCGWMKGQVIIVGCSDICTFLVAFNFPYEVYGYPFFLCILAVDEVWAYMNNHAVSCHLIGYMCGFLVKKCMNLYISS